jgi:alkylation response protein AidB-like acyl-CoA dehydrogenase
MMDLLYGEVEEDLRSSVRSLLTARSPWTAVLARVEGEEPYDVALWKTLAGEMGLAGLAVPEGLGGAGATFREVAVVIEELGRAVAPVPYLGSAVIVTATLLALGRSNAGGARAGAGDELLRQLAAGDRIAALALPFSTPPGPVVAADVTVDGDRLTGSVTSVADALPADVLLVPAGDGLYAVEVGAGARLSPVVSFDLTRRLADVALDGAAGRLLASGGDVGRAITTGLATGAALLASEQLGVAESCLARTVEYVKGRYQFGRPIGSFQALKHRLADVWVGVTQARAVARYAAACASDADADLELAASLAQAYCGPVAVTASEECVQMHGGIGFTWEHPAHLYLKRAKSSAIALGTADRHRSAVGRMAGVPAPPGS